MNTHNIKSDFLFEQASTAQLVLDPYQDKVVAVNLAVSRLIGLEQADIYAMSASQLFYNCFAELIVFTEETITSGIAWCDHLLIRTAESELRVEITASIHIESERSYIFMTLQPADEIEAYRGQSDAHRHYKSGISHWERISRVFSEFERENQLILDSAGEGIYGVDIQGVTTFVNPAAERILGYSKDELAGLNIHNMVHHTHADGSHYPINDCPIFEAIRDGKVHKVEDDVFWSKSGKAIDVEYTSTPIRENGMIVGAVVIFHDVSERKKDKKRLLDALNEVKTLKTQLEMENAYLQEEIESEFNHHQIVGKSPAIQATLKQIELVAPTEATVLISGESGTGKELIARAIHDISDRSNRPLIRVNCAAIPDELFESEFFGHMKGSFTGATSDKPGRFEIADGGTLFLDEVGEIPLHLQSKLLRVIQEQQFERIGDTRTRNVDVRIISATNRDLYKQVLAGDFREDLYFRLNVFPIESVPLRERQDDIPLLTQHFLNRAIKRNKKSDLRISLNELEKLKQYHWPGNIRELENIIERQVILSQGQHIRFDNLLASYQPVDNNNELNTDKILTEDDFRRQDKLNIISALKFCNGKLFGKDGAAELIGIKPTTLASRIKKYQIDRNSFKFSD